MANIFLSSTFSDLKDFRNNVLNAIQEAKHTNIAMEHFAAADMRPLNRCLEAVKDCDIYLGIFALKYGFIPEGEEESITILEYREALRLKKECLIFILKKDASWPVGEIEYAKHKEIEAFRDELTKRHTIREFSNKDDLRANVLASLLDRKKNVNSGIFQSPSLPPHYVKRTAILQEITKKILSNDDLQNIILDVIILHGIGGGGKTTLAKAICHTTEIRNFFKDGILWVTLGQNPDVLTLLVNWIKIFDQVYIPSTAQAAFDYLRTLFISSKYLIIIDDAWQSEIIKYFLVGGPGCKIIITTRRANIVEDAGGYIFSLNELTIEEAFTLLANRVKIGRGRELSRDEEHWANRLAKEAGYLPLALNLIGGLVARKRSWQETLEALEHIFQHNLSKASNKSSSLAKLEASIQLSIDWLREDNEDAFKNFCWLGVLSDEAKINKHNASILWDTDKVSAANYLSYFSDEAILTRDESNFFIHDLIHDVARNLLTNSGSRGLGIKQTDAHQQLINNYRKSINGKSWDNLVEDGYIHNHLFWHFQKSGNLEEQYQLLCLTADNGGNSWYIINEKLGNSANFLDNILVSWEMEIQNQAFRFGRQFRYALMISSLHSLAQAMSPELVEALIEKRIWTPIQVINYISQLSDIIRRSRAFLTALSFVKKTRQNFTEAEWSILESQIKIAVSNTMDELSATANSSTDALLLAQLSDYVEEPLRTNYIKISVSILYNFPDIFKNLIRIAPPAFLDFICESACIHSNKIEDPIKKCILITDCIGGLAQEKKQKWVQVLQELLDNVISGDILNSVTSEPNTVSGMDYYVKQSVLPQIVPVDPKTALKEKDDAAKEQVLNIIKKFIELGIEIPEKTLDNTNKLFENEYDLKKFINDIKNKDENSGSAEEVKSAHQLLFDFFESKHYILKAVDMIKKYPVFGYDDISAILDKFHWVDHEIIGYFMTLIAPHLAEDVLKLLCGNLSRSGNKSIGIQCIIASFTPGQHENFNNIISEFKTISRSKDKMYVEEALLSIVQICPLNIVQEALRFAQPIRDEKSRASTLFQFAPYITDGLRKEMIDYWSDEQLHGKQIVTLTKMLLDLSKAIKTERLTEFIKSASEFSSEWWIVEALTLTIKGLSIREELLTVIGSTSYIYNADLRARLLGRIVFRLIIKGYNEDVMPTLNLISLPIERWRIMCDLAIEAAKSGYMFMAEKIAFSIDNIEENGKALAHIALFHASNGEQIKALELISKIRSISWQTFIDKSFIKTNNSIKKVNIQNENNYSNGNEIETIDFTGIEKLLDEWSAFFDTRDLLTALQEKKAYSVIREGKLFFKNKNSRNKTFFETLSHEPRAVFLERIKQISPLILICCNLEDIDEIVSSISDNSKWWP